ncbi:hypothetical protein T07_13515 [Trichinella nelsoni]|uniref:Uncharacterized protein n=1 Tax=Trichinella nelsoni TaxID=6336 RepID=A0A0V0RA79_9BILA|nr:hypothetical protein T07_13515 [Trichinella nelsoni]
MVCFLTCFAIQKSGNGSYIWSAIHFYLVKPC